MLRNTLNNLPHIVLLRNDKIFHRLVKILKANEWREERSFLELSSGIRDFYPNYYRLDDMELSLMQEGIKESGIEYNEFTAHTLGEDYNLNFIENLFDYFFEFNGSKILAKEELLEEYLSFITKVSPLQVMGYKLAKMFINYEIDEESLAICVNAYTPLGLKVNKEKYADNHIHLKGAGYLAFNMFQIFTTPTNRAYYTEDFLHELPRINEFSYINNYRYSIGQLVDILKLTINYIYGSFMDNSITHEADFANELTKIKVFNQPIKESYFYSIENMIKMNQIFPIFKNKIEDNLLQEVIRFYQNEQYSQAHLMEYVLFFYCYEHSTSPFLKRIIKLFIHTSNILRSYMLMSQNYGLAHFSEFSRSPIRQIEQKSAKNTASSIIRSGTTHLNAKIGMPRGVNVLSKRLLTFRNAFDSQSSSIKYNFTLSVTKRKETHIRELSGELLARFYYKREALKKRALEIDDLMRNVRFKTLDEFTLALKERGIEAYLDKSILEKKSFDISRLVVALDAVGKETHTPPEVFAPFFRYLRNMPKELKNNIYKGLKIFELPPKLLLTVHAGEDFNHLVTGMRRVDESIEFFEMKRHDRLGHLLSLGITPDTWINNIGDIVLKKGDYLDDLIWLCWRLKQLKFVNISISKYMLSYEDKIWKLFYEIYPMFNTSIKLHHLYEAWKYRKSCILTCEKDEQGVVLFDSYSQCVFNKDVSSPVIIELFKLYQTNEEVRNKYREVMRIEKRSIDKEELMLWEAIQDNLIEDIATKGIVVETNPSSNIFISLLDSYEHHPIFRFHPPKSSLLEEGEVFNKYGQRRGSVNVTINSDDPAIFVTSLQNEFRILKNIAKKRYNCTDKEVDEWLNEIRLFGIKLFKESYNERA